jgi:hypothetical protein
MRDTTTDQDAAVGGYAAFVLFPNDNPIEPFIRVDLEVVPTGPDWHMLARPGQPFAVFYTEAAGSPDAIADSPSGGATYNLDGDARADYRKRSFG